VLLGERPVNNWHYRFDMRKTLERIKAVVEA
jgi:hypothetical protein